jgi:Cu+-exporting ATPase
MSETAHAQGSSCNHGGHAGHGHHHADAGKTTRDPVCGMRVNPETSKHRLEHDGTSYHFCSNGCRTKFAADPVKYLDKAKAAAEAKPAPVPAGTIYTCPMHPQIRQV